MTKGFKFIAAHIDMIRVGDVVNHAEVERTVGPDNLKRGGFHGTTLWGDSYRLGSLPVLLRVKT